MQNPCFLNISCVFIFKEARKQVFASVFVKLYIRIYLIYNLKTVLYLSGNSGNIYYFFKMNGDKL